MHEREVSAYLRLWEINVGKIDGKIQVDGFLNEELDDNERTATTTDLTTLAGNLSNSNTEDDEDSTEENRPRPPLERMLYNGNGASGNRA